MTHSQRDSDDSDRAALAPLYSALREHGFAIATDLLPSPLLRALAADCAAAESDGRLRAAGTGRGTAHRVDPALRGDAIWWLERGEPNAAQTQFLDRMEALRIALNRELMLGLHELEAHYATYPPGAGYARHRDRFRDDDARVLSLVVYLNEDWGAVDGGQLRLHLPDGVRDVSPRLGTSVWFLSAEIEHEVFPAQRARRSIAGWFRQRGV